MHRVPTIILENSFTLSTNKYMKDGYAQSANKYMGEWL